MVDSLKPVADLAKSAHDRLRQDFQAIAAEEQAVQAAGDPATIDEQTFVDAMLARVPAGQADALSKLYKRFEGKDGQPGMSEDEFDALLSQSLASGDAASPAAAAGLSAEERRAVVFNGRQDLADAATAEADRLFGAGETLTPDQFVQQAQLAGLGPTELETLYKRYAGAGPMTREQFDRVYANATGSSGYREVVDNPSDVNVTGDVANDARDAAEAAQLAPAVAAARAALTPEARAQYDQVAASVATNPQAAAALAKLLVDGRLPGTKPNAAGQDTLAALAALAAQPMQPPLDNRKVLGELVQELENPAAINQGYRGTCVATSAQIVMAQADPAEYVRLIGGLASPEGRVTMRNGEDLVREPGTEAPAMLLKANPDGTYSEYTMDARADTARLFAPAAMEYANGADRDYDNTKDQHSPAEGQADSGLSVVESARLEGALVGAASEGLTLPTDGQERRDALDRLVETIKSGRPLQCALRWAEDRPLAAPGNHQVVVTKVEGDYVYFNNPWGQQERISVAEFEKRVYAATLPSL